MSSTKPCEICGSDVNDDLIMTCDDCKKTREHTYCARGTYEFVPREWLCDECLSRTYQNTTNESCDEVSVKPCEICGSDANDDLIMTCYLCETSREHTYCTREKLESVPNQWVCEECSPKDESCDEEPEKEPEEKQEPCDEEPEEDPEEEPEEDPEEDPEEEPEEEQEPCDKEPEYCDEESESSDDEAEPCEEAMKNQNIAMKNQNLLMMKQNLVRKNQSLPMKNKNIAMMNQNLPKMNQNIAMKNQNLRMMNNNIYCPILLHVDK